MSVDKCGNKATGNDVYHLRRIHSFHPSNSSCKRLIGIVSGMYYISQSGIW